MNEEINSNENNLFEIVNEDNSKNIAMQNYNELLEKFENLIKIIIAKINVGKQNAQNNTEDGIFKDLESNIIELDNTYLALISYLKILLMMKRKKLLIKPFLLKKQWKILLNLLMKFKKYHWMINLNNITSKLINFAK